MYLTSILIHNRFGRYNCDAGHFLPNVFGNCVMLAKECVPRYLLCFLFRHDRSALFHSFPSQVPRRGMGPNCPFFHLPDSHVCLALWHVEKVRVRCSKQGFCQLVTYVGSRSRHGTGSWDWTLTHSLYQESPQSSPISSLIFQPSTKS